MLCSMLSSADSTFTVAVGTIVWYTILRLLPSRWALSLPWAFFTVAFLLVGLPSLSKVFFPSRVIITSLATYFYAGASSAGFLFFSLNFGEEAGAATEIWVLRACIVQGAQQIWVAALWYWCVLVHWATRSLIPPCLY